MRLDTARRVELERWIALIRVAWVPLAVLQVALTEGYPHGYRIAGWAVTGVLAVGAGILLRESGQELGPAAQERLAWLALAFDTAIVSAFSLLYYWQPGSPTRQLLFVPLVEAAVRYRTPGALLLAAVSFPVLAFFEALRSNHVGSEYNLGYVVFQVVVSGLIGVVVGWLVSRLRGESSLAERRAREAEALRDELGRRADLLDAANRCARALASSLDLDQAFSAFVRELRGLVALDRVALILVDGERAEVIAVAGLGADATLPPGTLVDVEGSVLEEALEGRTIVRDDMAEPAYREEPTLVGLGLRSRLVAPLLVGARPIGVLIVSREEPGAFGRSDVELVSLLGRLVATAVQNIRAYEAEHETVEELRRLSALRADFVSLVSHELRSPMAAVIGAARTLQARWPALTAPQRESFVGLIAAETSRLATLIGDVLDTSRIEAGTFSYSFEAVDVGELVRETVAAACFGQSEVGVVAAVTDSLPRVRGDRERLRQVLLNLIDNAVKYSEAGSDVAVTARTRNGSLVVEVADRGPGIPRDQQRLIFEKFGRARSGRARPGTGLGLFISRSIAEAHGGSLDVRSGPGRGSIFTLALPVDGER